MSRFLGLFIIPLIILTHMFYFTVNAAENMGSLSAVELSAIELSSIAKQINASYENQVQLSVEKVQLETQIKEVQIKIKTKKTLLIKRLKALYSLRQFKWGELIFNNNLNTLEKNIRILKNINKYDSDLFKEYIYFFKQLSQARKNLLETETLIQQNIDSLKRQQAEFYRLEKARLSSLQKEKKDSLLMYKGYLARPLEGELKQEFGTLRDQQNQFYLINRGELYVAEVSTPVTAIGPGVVIFRDALTRWRETLIIQHADNYYSVYAGVKNLKKVVGEQVEKNELVGATADEEFYFELRHFDNTINPKSWYGTTGVRSNSE